MTNLAPLLAAGAGEVGLTLSGGVLMVLSIGLVVGLNVFCLYRITREPRPSEHLHAPPDIDTRDVDNG